MACFEKTPFAYGREIMRLQTTTPTTATCFISTLFWKVNHVSTNQCVNLNCRTWGKLDWNSCRRRMGDVFCKIPPTMGCLRPWILMIFGQYPRNQLASKGLSLFWFMKTSCDTPEVMHVSLSRSAGVQMAQCRPTVFWPMWLWHPPCCYEASRQLTYHHPKYVWRWVSLVLSSRWDMLVPCKGTFSSTCINVVRIYLL